MAEHRWLRVSLVLALLAAGADAQRRGARGQGAVPSPTPLPEAGPKSDSPLYLPGYDKGGAGKSPQAKSPQAKKGARPPGPRPKDASKKAAEAKPVDPMKEADLVTATAEHRAAVEEARRQQMLDHFRVCDLDGNGWISLREGEITLSLDRGEYRRHDKNQDGRLDESEFLAQQNLFLSRLGATPPPAVKTGETKAATEAVEEPSPALGAEDPGTQTRLRGRFQGFHSELGAMRVKPGDLLRRYDADGSKGIDALEIGRLFSDLDLQLVPDLVIAQMDPNGSGELELAELVPVAWIASQHAPEPPPALEPGEDSSPAQEAPPLADDGLLPALEPNPHLTHFARLDANDDGALDEDDLRTLQSPVRLELRLRAILSALDRDGDGRLSESEFRAAMLDSAR